MSKLSRSFKIATSGLRPLPDFVIIGAPRCGTTFLYETLGQHPNIRLADEKEIHFFDSPEFQKGPGWYRSHFPVLWERLFKKRRVITGEASPYYLIHPHAARRMADLIPDAKLIVLLRNPVDRAYSHYNRKSGKWESLSFEEALDAEPERLENELEKMMADEHYRSHKHKHFSYLQRGIYVDQLKAFEKYFPRERILVLKSEEMFETPSTVYARTLEFLGLPPMQPRNVSPLNAGHYSDMKPETRKRLEEYYAPHNQRLYEYLGEDFGW